jgi:putative PEP-CTERM system integral membrane protein
MDFMIPFFGLVAAPTTAAVFTIKRPKTPFPSVFRLFYGIEMPLIFLLSFRFFALRQLTPATTFLVVTAILGMVAFGFRNFWRDRPTPGWGLWLQTIGYGLMLASSLYGLAIYSFFALPFLVSIFRNIAVWPQAIVGIVTAAPVMVIVFGYLSVPIGMAFVTLRDYKGMLRAFSSQVGKLAAWAIGLALPLVWAGSLILLQHQPQIKALQWLSQPATTPVQRQELLDKSSQIRQGLLNAYLSKYRYLGVQGKPNEYDSVAYLFREFIGLPTAMALEVQKAYNDLVSPFFYAGDSGDSDKASDLYARFFDQPILRGEPDAVSAAVNSTFDRITAKAGLMDINQQKVLLGQQDLTVTPHGDWADVAIHEVYQNQTSEQLEVLYYFSLPESATPTGVWLGESNDLNKRFVFTVSPRGAAQQVYTNQTVRRVDPALLEQVGPGNYRLRAFPVLPKGQKPMHLWLTYKAMQQPDGGWPLPQLQEKRNIFWTGASQRKINGKAIAGGTSTWFPASLAANTKPAQTHVVNFSSGERVVAEPFTSSVTALPQNQRFAVVLDSSLSMQSQRAKLNETLSWLKTKLLPNNQLDLYLSSAEGISPTRVPDFSKFDLNSVQFYGTLQPKQMLAQFLKLKGEQAYDGILLVTDPGSYELTTDQAFKASLPAPLWMVHLGGLAAAYDDDTQQAIQVSGGGVTTQVETAIQRLLTNRQLGKNLVNVVDGYAWRRLPAAAPVITLPATANPNANFAPIAARQLVQARSRDLQPNQVAELDAIHAIAKEQGIVTPYSSMIVLVNDQQRRELKDAENAADRFNREVEDQQLKAPNGVGEISGVPEPQEWLLLIAALAVGAAGWRWLRPAQPAVVVDGQGSDEG